MQTFESLVGHKLIADNLVIAVTLPHRPGRLVQHPHRPMVDRTASRLPPTLQPAMARREAVCRERQ